MKHSLLENELAAGQTDDGWTMVEPKHAEESRLVVARLANETIQTADQPKHGPIPFPKKDDISKQERIYSPVTMKNDHECDHECDYVHDQGLTKQDD